MIPNVNVIDWQHRSLSSSQHSSPVMASASGLGSVTRLDERYVKPLDDLALDNQTESSGHSIEISAVPKEPRPFAMSFLRPHQERLHRSMFESFNRMSDTPVKENINSLVPASVQFLMSRSLEEEKDLSAKSDKEKAYLYKKRYTDMYEHAVALLKHAAMLERELNEYRDTEMINSFDDTQNLSEFEDYKQEDRIQALCREITGLVLQVNERDAVIKSLLEDRSRSARELNELNLSRGLNSSKINEGIKDTSCALELDLKVARREQQEALERESKGIAHLRHVQELYEKCEAARSTLSDGLDRAEDQISALHAQWMKEKKELLSLLKKNDQKMAKALSECERLQIENDDLANSLQKILMNEKKKKLAIESQRQALSNLNAEHTHLEANLDALRPQSSVLDNTKARILTLERELAGATEMIRRYLLQVDDLKKKLERKKEKYQTAKGRFQKSTAHLEKRVFNAEAVRRSLHNKVMELKGNIRVFCRVRPILEHELTSSRGEKIFSFPDYRSERRQIELSANPTSHVGYGQHSSSNVIKKYSFDFDLVFNSSCSQDDVFLEVSALIQSGLDGYNVCIFAYGQTGSGKTYTMQGSNNVANCKLRDLWPDLGIVGRAFAQIFKGIEELRTGGWDFTASLELIEIYNETFRDLLAPIESHEKIELRQDSEGKTVVVNSFSQKIGSDQEAWDLLRGAISKRSTNSTQLNDKSSRSHCVITLRLKGKNSLTNEMRTGVINLVDLAGSEHVSKSGSDSSKKLLKEATSINKSLSALGNVMCSLAKKSTHVPFRDTKLTHFLSSSLSGDSKTLMICNLSPLGEHRCETLNSLRFAKMVNSCEIAFPSRVSRGFTLLQLSSRKR